MLVQRRSQRLSRWRDLVWLVLPGAVDGIRAELCVRPTRARELVLVFPVRGQIVKKAAWECTLVWSSCFGKHGQQKKINKAANVRAVAVVLAVVVTTRMIRR